MKEPEKPAEAEAADEEGAEGAETGAEQMEKNHQPMVRKKRAILKAN